jgi:hypothetical protein
VLSPTMGKVAHVLLTRSPLGTPLSCERKALARLACVRHAASVNPEPGSNSPFEARTHGSLALSLVDSKSLSHSSVVKVLPPFPLPRSSTASLPFGIPDCLDRGRAKPFGGRRTGNCNALVAETQPRSLLSIPTPGDLQTPLRRRRPAGPASRVPKHTATEETRLRRLVGRSWPEPALARRHIPGPRPRAGRGPAWSPGPQAAPGPG